ncbi:ATP-binding protein [Zavarzinella formosa]|uniref:ATP-binding protein n=1 Tax=Zavarzinella formosa TaxID=360055 RepID=UPI0002FF8D6A|nr:ATP-binding protein [Zavarzinella formosa]
MDSSSPDGKLGDLKEVDFTCPAHGHQRVKVVRLTEEWASPTCGSCDEERLSSGGRAEDQRNGVRAREAKEYQIRNHLAKSAIPARFEGRSFTNYQADDDESRKALATCRDFATEFPDRLLTGSSLILCGNAGTGKTHLACAIALHVIRKHALSAAYMTVGRAFRMVKDTYRRDSGKTEQEVLSRFAAPELLVLDEIGIQYGSDSEKNILFEIVNERYEALLPTILISNLALPALTEYAGERVIDRMKENGGKLVVFDWKSHRGAT